MDNPNSTVEPRDDFTQRPIPTPEMISAGCSAGWAVGEGRIGVKQVIAIYRAMRVLDPAPLPIGWENVPDA